MKSFIQYLQEKVMVSKTNDFLKKDIANYVAYGHDSKMGDSSDAQITLKYTIEKIGEGDYYSGINLNPREVETLKTFKSRVLSKYPKSQSNKKNMEVVDKIIKMHSMGSRG